MLISHRTRSLRPTPGCGRKKVKMKPPWWARHTSTSKNQIKVLPTILIAFLIACDSVGCLSTASYVISTGNSPERAHENPQLSQAAARSPDQAAASSLPYFNTTTSLPSASSSSLVIVGSSYQNEIYLPCPILNLDDDQTISWIRKRDSLVLTIDKVRLVDDNRFQLTQVAEDWTLVLSQPNDSDAGHYECQVSSMEPKLSHLVELRMVPAESAISNFSSLFVRPNDVINLTCTISAPQKTSYVYWYKNKDVIYFDKLVEFNLPESNKQVSTSALKEKKKSLGKPRTERNIGHKSELYDREEMMYDSLKPSRDVRRQTFVAMKATKYGQTRQQAGSLARWSPSSSDVHQNDTNNSGTTEQQPALATSSSTLIIKRAQLNDTANYTCLPSNAKPSQIRVIVIENGGLGSQPEKRSLQADSALSSLGPLPSLWFKKLKLLCLVTCEKLISWTSIDLDERLPVKIVDDDTNDWLRALINLLMDRCLILLALSIGMVIHLGLMHAVITTS